MEHANTTEKIGIGLVCSLKTYKGAKIQLVKCLSGFNGLSVYKGGWQLIYQSTIEEL